ncbi:MAG: DegT/DnrJ/EryC1/StrS family aminotransferase [Pseudomonadota bacterium]
MIGIADTKLTEAEIGAAVEVLKSGMLRQGPQVASFEKEFGRFVGARHAIANVNGSTALHIAFADFLEPGDEVLVPSFTFISTATMVIAAGGVPIMCDVDPATWTIDLADAESRVTERTRAIVPVHLFGNVCDIEAVQDLAGRHNLKIVWDAAQAHGATYDGHGVGGFGDYVTYSFYPSKNMFVGEGGVTCTQNADSDRQLRLLREHGMPERYLHTVLGYNYRMTDITAAIGREQLKRLPAMLDRRRKNADRLLAGLAGTPGLTLPIIAPKAGHAWHQFCVLVDEAAFGRSRDGLSEFLRDNGVGSAVHYPRGLHQQPVFIERYGEMSLPVTEDLAARILALPVHHGLSDSDIDRVVEAVRIGTTR